MRRAEINDHIRGAKQSFDYLEKHAGFAHRQLQSWSRSGFPSNTGLDKIRSSGSDSSPVEIAALNPDEPSQQAERLAKCLKQANQLAAEAASIAKMTLTPPEHKQRVNQVPECINCSEPCVPRAKKGRCPACYEYQRTHKGQERPV